MITSPALAGPMSNKNYCQIATDTFQRYANSNLEGNLFLESIKIDFKN